MKNLKSPAIHRTPLYRAKSAYYSMTQRCGNANGKSRSYANVKLLMTEQEFLEWAVPQYEKFITKNPDESPCVSRSGDAGNYEIGNIQITSTRYNRETQVMRKTPIRHGTSAGYWKEKRSGLPVCVECREAMREYYRNYKRKRTSTA